MKTILKPINEKDKHTTHKLFSELLNCNTNHATTKNAASGMHKKQAWITLSLTSFTILLLSQSLKVKEHLKSLIHLYMSPFSTSEILCDGTTMCDSM